MVKTLVDKSVEEKVNINTDTIEHQQPKEVKKSKINIEEP